MQEAQSGKSVRPSDPVPLPPLYSNLLKEQALYSTREPTWCKVPTLMLSPKLGYFERGVPSQL